MPDRITPRRIVSVCDPALEARIVRRVPMHYATGADAALDRPGHVRAASSVAWIGDRIALVQDDANFIALVDPSTGQADAITLPAGKDDARTFDDARGNKKHKLDLEAMTRVPVATGAMLVAFGSGSKKRRENVLTLRFAVRDSPPVHDQPSLVPLPDLYAALRAEREFAGSEMNIEGALYLDGMIRLFGRGNGEARDEMHPLDATCDINWHALVAHLANPDADTVPAITRITQYALGEVDGVGFGFTDAIRAGRTSVFYSAAAEASKDAGSDGEVGGSALGVIPNDRRHTPRWTPVLDESGQRFTGKIEGLVLDPADASRALVVVDVDDHTHPSELCEIVLGGPWTTR